LLDTNVFMRLPQPSHPISASLWRTIRAMEANGDQFVFVSQNAIEAWNSLTRPVEKNGFGFTHANAARALPTMGKMFDRLPDTDDVYPRWLELVERHEVSGKQVHDTRLVAAMLAGGVDAIATLNARDFRRFASERIVVLDMTPDGI
jgi:predicted nucleic acid-binding protein